METTILVVDDAVVERRLAGSLLEQQLGANVIYAENGVQALEAIERDHPDIVVTDMLMPKMDGLKLVENIKIRHPNLPVVLMTAFGGEDVAIRALQNGAVGYVPKKNLTQDIVPAVRNLMQMSTVARNYQELMDCLTETEARFQLANDPELVPPLLSYVEGNLNRFKVCEGIEVMRVAVAVREAVLNAMQRGNLEVPGELREHDEIAYYDLIEKRRLQAPYQNRRVHILARESRWEAVYVIRDEGPGFDRTKVADPSDPASFDREVGKGMLLISTFMDEVRHNDSGNEITLIKRHARATS